MSTELQPLDLIRPEGIVNPETGELVPLPAVATPRLARMLGLVQHNIDAYLDALYQAKRMLGDEMIKRMDKSASWTVHEPGVEVTAPSPKAGSVDWNAEKLDGILSELVEENVIDREARLRAVWPDTVYKTDKRAISALLKIPGVAERVESARITSPASSRKVKVTVDPRHL